MHPNDLYVQFMTYLNVNKELRGMKTEMAKINASDGNLCDREAAQAEAQTFNI